MRDSMENRIEKIIRQVFREEGRVFYGDKVSWFFVVIGDQVIFRFNAPYAGIVDKVQKKVFSSMERYYSLSRQGRYFIDSVMQPNFTVGKFRVLGNDYYICEIKDFSQELCSPYENLCKAYYGVSSNEFRGKELRYRLPLDLPWDDFKEIYRKAFGRFPCVSVRDHSNNLLVL